MAVLLPQGTAQVVFNYSGLAFDSGVGATVFGVSGLPAGTQADLEAVAALLSAEWDGNVMSVMDADIVHTTTLIYNDVSSAEIVVNNAGGRPGQNVPPNVALLVRKLTAVRGRRAQGRFFLPGMLAQDEVNEDGTLSTPARTRNQTAMTDFLAAVNTNIDLNMVVLQNSEGVSPPITPPPLVTGLLVDAKVASQRRRLRS